MGSGITTVSVQPHTADELRNVRDELDLSSMDAALEELLKSHRQ